MNCRQARQLISPYLDQQLTGEEMIAMQQHLSHCPECAEEHRQVREVRLLLRSLSTVQPGQSLDRQIARRTLSPLRSPVVSFPPLPRGGRLVVALALSCIALLALAEPFAPSARDIAANSVDGSPHAFERDLVRSGFLPSSPSASRLPATSASFHSFSGMSWTTPGPSVPSLPSGGASVTLAGWGAEPLDDDAVGGYAAGDVVSAERRGQ